MATKYLPTLDNEGSPQHGESQKAKDWMAAMCANVTDVSLRINLPRVKEVLAAAVTIPDAKRLQDQTAPRYLGDLRRATAESVGWPRSTRRYGLRRLR